MIRSRQDVDVVVVGAGAAGLAAAAELARRGLSACVLEAKDRIGGRMLTRHEPDLDVPIELGAEFIHGQPGSTLSRLSSIGAVAVDVATGRWVRAGGNIEPGEDPFAELNSSLARVPRPERDLSFADFLNSDVVRQALSERTRRFALTLIEGFDAADAARASTWDTLDEWRGQSAADAPTFRPSGGYTVLLRALSAALDPRHVQVRLGAIVTSVRWRRGSVTVTGTHYGRSFSVRAGKAIVTLPIGVLQSPPGTPGAVQFDPPLNAKRDALAGLAAGAVVKLVMRFREPFWEHVDGGRYRDAVFFQAAGATFPTFWTALPMRAPLLTAWAAGPNALRLGGSSRDDVVARAMSCLQELFDSRAHPGRDLQAVYWHDWQADPFARGAYSYVTVGGKDAHAALTEPLEDTLYIAGEAADVGGASGTVAGALDSGEQAAAQCAGGKSSRAT